MKPREYKTILTRRMIVIEQSVTNAKYA